MMAVYVRDLIWQKLSTEYGVTPTTHTVDDVFEIWQQINSIGDGVDLGAFYTSATGIANFGDAEMAYWDAYVTDTFTPASITTQGWWDASDSSSITLTSGKVSAWADKSGNSRTASQATANNRPVVATAYQNGLDALNFYADSTADWLTAGTTSTWNFLHDGSVDVLIAVVWQPFKTAPTSGTQSTAVNTTNVTGGSKGVSINYNTPTTGDRFQLYIPNGAGGTSTTWPVTVFNTPTSNSLQTVPSVYTARYGPNADTAIRAYTNANSEFAEARNRGSGDFGTGNSTLAFTIGCSISSQNPCRGYIMEVIVVSGAAATETNRLRIQGYLNQKWGVY